MILQKILSNVSISILPATSRASVLATCTRNSQFGPQFIDPIFKHEDIDRLVESGQIKNYQDIPIKPPTHFQSCSTLYDFTKEKFMNYMMRNGQKKMAYSLLTATIKFIKIYQIEKYNKATSDEEKQAIELDPDVIMMKGIENAKPMLKLRGIKRGAITYQVPIPMSDKESTAVAMKWYVEIAKDKPSKITFAENLAVLLIDGANNKGKVVKRKTDLHRQCEANRAYAHYYFG